MGRMNDVEHVWEMIKDLSIAMLVTRDGAHLRARPMGVYPRQSENTIYFLTDARLHKDAEIAAHPDVCVAFSENGRYVSISGTASVTNDRATIRELFDAPAKMWWDSAEDANIRLLKVAPDEAEYWETPGRAVSFAKMAAAAVTGSRPDLGDNVKTQM